MIKTLFNIPFVFKQNTKEIFYKFNIKISTYKINRIIINQLLRSRGLSFLRRKVPLSPLSFPDLVLKRDRKKDTGSIGARREYFVFHKSLKAKTNMF